MSSMEMHKHSHAVTHKKRCGEYLLEIPIVIPGGVSWVYQSSRNFFTNYMLPWYLKHIKSQDALGDTILHSNTMIIDRTEGTDKEVLNITDSNRIFILSVQEKMFRPAAMHANRLITMIKKEYQLE